MMDTIKQRLKLLIKPIIFLSLFIAIFTGVSGILTNPEPNSGQREYQRTYGFYEEPVDSLDVVFVGGSNVYEFWMAPLAYRMYGIASWPFATPSLRFTQACSVIESIKERQKNALYIVTLNSLYDTSEVQIHYLIDYIPFSAEKMKLIGSLATINRSSFSDSMEFYFPIIRFHERWSKLQKEDFSYSVDGLKGASVLPAFFNHTTDVTGGLAPRNGRAELSSSLVQYVNDFLDYIEDNELTVLFLEMPMSFEESDKTPEMMNSLEDIIRERGHGVLDLMEEVDGLGLDPAADFDDRVHTNIHGAIKVTDYISRYLVSEYALNDRRGGSDYASWEQAYEKYYGIIEPYLTEEEIAYLQ